LATRQQALAASKTMQSMLKEQERAGRWIGAICAAPAVVLAPLGLLDDREATCYPSLAEQLTNFESQGAVIVSKKISM
jgi:protein deglycase